MKVVLYQDPQGRSQIKEWLGRLKRDNPYLYTKAMWLLREFLPTAALQASSDQVKHIRGPIWEVRHRSGLRIYYWRQEEKLFVAAAGEVKSRSKADPSLVEYALRAYEEYNQKAKGRKEKP
ncbi:hypothetical protein YIM1640_22090 [Thermus oshimai]|uniref:hypothetical protein n=1 Tax=Thermus oshimai TaxID=56957 RepID=UPI0003825FAE|nr:hypothetical protein [Thermus oshimai]